MKIKNYNYNVIFFGEKHGVQENFELYINKIKSFNEDNLVCILEVGYSSGIYIDNYINGIEIFPLKDFVLEFKNTMMGSYEYGVFIKKLKDYNKTLKNKIHVIGIDVEYQENIALKILNYVNENGLEYEKNNIEKNIDNVKYLNNLSESDYEIEREKMLYNNFVNYYKKEKNYICFMGLYHTKYNSEDNNLVMMLKKYKINFIGIEIIYKNTFRTIRENDEFKVIKIDDAIMLEEYDFYPDKNIYLKNEQEGAVFIKNGNALKMIY